MTETDREETEKEKEKETERDKKRPRGRRRREREIIWERARSSIKISIFVLGFANLYTGDLLNATPSVHLFCIKALEEYSGKAVEKDEWGERRRRTRRMKRRRRRRRKWRLNRDYGKASS